MNPTLTGLTSIGVSGDITLAAGSSYKIGTAAIATTDTTYAEGDNILISGASNTIKVNPTLTALTSIAATTKLDLGYPISDTSGSYTNDPLIEIGRSTSYFKGILIGGWDDYVGDDLLFEDSAPGYARIQASANLHIDSPDGGLIYLNHYVGDDVIITHDAYINGTIVNGSDDRLKHNEVDVVNALGTIMLLKVQTYDRTFRLMDADLNGDLSGFPHFKDTGFIAQDVELIDELKHLITPGDEKRPYGIKYNGIIPFNTKAIQELNNKVIQLEAELSAIKQHLNI